jgi:hypothetical protein
MAYIKPERKVERLDKNQSVSLVSGAGREPAKDEFLYQAVDHAAAGGDKGIIEHQARAAIRLGIVGI